MPKGIKDRTGFPILINVHGIEEETTNTGIYYSFFYQLGTL